LAAIISASNGQDYYLRVIDRVSNDTLIADKAMILLQEEKSQHELAGKLHGSG
jgi:hypothetical protein